MIYELLHDLRFALRMLRKNPGFTVIAVLTLALGIGANSAIFSIANAVIIQPLPFRDPDHLVTVLETKASQNLDWLYVTGNNFVQWQERSESFEHLAGLLPCGYRLAQEGEPQLVPGNCVSARIFPMLGVKPSNGRKFTAEEDQLGRDTRWPAGVRQDGPRPVDAPPDQDAERRAVESSRVHCST